MQKREKRSVLLGMSGGTDSSVAAMLLLDAGYSVTGVTFRFYEHDGSTAYLDDAKELADRLNIAHITYDARDIFRQQVVDYFIREYMAGHTPVPCVVCNNTLKWPLLDKIAHENGIDYISTGHYVRIVYEQGHYYIRQAVDPDKDQSFFLWGLSQHLLSRMVLPMGEITKTEARAFAAGRGFRKVSQKKDSIGVCFCPFDYHTFLRKHVDGSLLQQGRFVDEQGEFIANHQGYPFYTVGQRRGLGIHLNRAVYVKEIRVNENEVVLSSLRSLEKSEMWLQHTYVTDDHRLLGRDDIIVKIRYRKQINRCTVERYPDNRLLVHLHEPLTAVAPGQAAAFYDGDVVIGGGIIC